MPAIEPITETVTASEARRCWSALITDVAGKQKRVIVEKSGTPVVALISADEFKSFQRYDQQQQERFRILEQMSEPFKDMPLEEIEREVARAIQEVREENRRAKQQRQELAGVLERMRDAFRDLPPEEIEKEFDRVVLETRDKSNAAAKVSSRS